MSEVKQHSQSILGIKLLKAAFVVFTHIILTIPILMSVMYITFGLHMKGLECIHDCRHFNIKTFSMLKLRCMVVWW